MLTIENSKKQININGHNKKNALESLMKTVGLKYRG